ncbi:MAG: hypothetical protein O2973_05945 [Gemmatimonadetes bacterium]|nr:hypothetical protein [Gemmatimonadota bacterium]
MTIDLMSSPKSGALPVTTLAGVRAVNQPVHHATGRSPRWLTLWTAAVLAVTSACSAGKDVTAPGGSDNPGGSNGPATPVGSYTLSTVDAKPLPWTMYADTGYTLQLQSGTLAITADGKWVSKVVSLENVAGNLSTYSDSTFGTWTVAPGAKTAVITNVETNSTSSATWTSTAATVVQLDGATSHTIVYTKN